MLKCLQFKNACLKYKNAQNDILSNINVEIQGAKMVAIVGPSGAGKSTFFKAIVRNLIITKGQILWDGLPIEKIPNKRWTQIMNRIGFLNQKPNLINTDNVYNNIVRSISQYKNWFYKLFNILTKEQKVKIFETLEQLGILDKSFYRVSELSGGQQQRVEIAKLLVKNVDLILADEPTSNLDFETAEEVLSILRDLNRQHQITTLVNIHDLDLALKYFDEILLIKDGKIALHKNAKETNKWELMELIKK